MTDEAPSPETAMPRHPPHDLEAPLGVDTIQLALDFPPGLLDALKAIAEAGGYLTLGEVVREVVRNAVRETKAEERRAATLASAATPDSADILLAYAVWMVGNMDTPIDKAAWWADNRQTWERAAVVMQALAEDGINISAGIEPLKASLAARVEG